MDLKQTYNKIAEDWNEDHKDDRWPHEDAREFASYLKKGDKVLDIGCGSGLKAKVMQEEGLKVTGIDISDKMIKLAKKKSPRSSFFVMDMRDINNFKKPFDGIFAQAAFLHIPKKEIYSVFKKVVAKLKDEGFIYIALKGKRVGGKDEEILKEEDYGYKYERFFSYFSRDEVLDLLRENSLRLTKDNSETSDQTYWIRIIAKKETK